MYQMTVQAKKLAPSKKVVHLEGTYLNFSEAMCTCILIKINYYAIDLFLLLRTKQGRCLATER